MDGLFVGRSQLTYIIADPINARVTECIAVAVLRVGDTAGLSP